MNIIGIDFEDWFHPELIQKYLQKKNNKPKVFQGIGKIIDLLRKNETNAEVLRAGTNRKSNE